MISIYEERGIIKGQREILMTLLHSKFGTLPAKVMAQVEKIESSDELKALSSKVLTANSLEDMGLTEN